VTGDRVIRFATAAVVCAVAAFAAVVSYSHTYGLGRGRPRVCGTRLPKLAGLAAAAAFTQVTVTRCGKTGTVQAAAVTCLWYTVFGTRPVQVVLVRDKSASGYDLALVTTNLNAIPAQAIERYAARWSIEVGHRWYRSSCVAFSWLRSLFLAGFSFRLRPAGSRVEARRACPAFA
jgi:hypothetical protein